MTRGSDSALTVRNAHGSENVGSFVIDVCSKPDARMVKQANAKAQKLDKEALCPLVNSGIIRRSLRYGIGVSGSRGVITEQFSPPVLPWYNSAHTATIA